MPREWIDRGTLLREYWKKQKSKQMNKLTELARAESKAWYVYLEATRVRQEAEVAEEAASFAWDYAHSGYKAELKKTQKEQTND